MPKLKTHSGAKKRFKKLASGKVKYKKQGKRHMMTPDSNKRMRQLRKAGIMTDTNAETILRRFLPYA
jgi:large subunit ribosomal protein L35